MLTKVSPRLFIALNQPFQPQTRLSSGHYVPFLRHTRFFRAACLTCRSYLRLRRASAYGISTLRFIRLKLPGESHPPEIARAFHHGKNAAQSSAGFIQPIHIPAPMRLTLIHRTDLQRWLTTTCAIGGWMDERTDGGGGAITVSLPSPPRTNRCEWIYPGPITSRHSNITLLWLSNRNFRLCTARSDPYRVPSWRGPPFH